ncbi:MAG: phospholipid carrier-dependent glycosyltransferase [Opitutus sp.]|nr:phospholipid carrier-dependent glycosyltransferase [Opitutus sp.]
MASAGLLLFAPAIFFATVFGLAWPLAARLPLAPAEKIAASAALSLIGIWLFAWTVYVWALPLPALGALPVLAGAGLAFRHRELVATGRDCDARELLIGQLLVTSWCVGWLAFVSSYSGGGWAADWFEHWDRARFFLERGPRDTQFLGHYALTARPPLANVVTGAFLQLTRVDFAHYQLVCTLLSSLVLLPLALLARRFGRGRHAIALGALLLLVNPLFVQNATFAWTKLPAAFFTLTALYFFLRAQEPGAPRATAVLFGATLAAALLAHYSAGPSAVVLSLAWIPVGWVQRNNSDWRRASVLGAVTGGLLLATWFAWALGHYGLAGTFLSNTSVTSPEVHQGGQLAKILLNLRDTLVPHFLRPLDAVLIAQTNVWGTARDWFFQLYQLNLPLACGSVASFALGREAWRAARGATSAVRTGWTVGLVAVVLLSVTVHGERDHWGLTHICLQGVVLLALAFLAARWTELGRGWRLALLAGATVDFTTGIALQFAAQSFALDRWFAHGTDPTATYNGYNESAFMNLAAKIQHQLVFFADRWPLPPALALVGLAAILGLMLARARATAP